MDYESPSLGTGAERKRGSREAPHLIHDASGSKPRVVMMMSAYHWNCDPSFQKESSPRTTSAQNDEPDIHDHHIFPAR